MGMGNAVYKTINPRAKYLKESLEEKFAEAQEKPQLCRPQTEQVGKYWGLMGCEWEPVEARSQEESKQRILSSSQEIPSRLFLWWPSPAPSPMKRRVNSKISAVHP